MNHAKLPALLFLVSALCACSDAAPAPTPEPAPAPAEPTTQPAAVPTPAPAAEMPPAPENAKVAFAEPADGATITGPAVDGKVEVKVAMAAKGVEVKPAGEVQAGSGHHHILVDAEDIPQGAVIPMDESHLHFGKGQTEATLALTPGEHTLTMQLADGIHRSYGPGLSAKIKITVAVGPAADAPAADAPEATAEGTTEE